MTIILPLPDRKLSPNARVHWRALHAAKRDARDTARMLATLRLNGSDPPMWDRARAKVTWYFPTARGRDPDNAMASLKAYWDGLEDAGIVANDCGIWPDRPEFMIDRDKPRIEIEIREETL